MHYYPHHVGDYQRDTAHLSIVEHGVYRLLMDSYYSTERPLPADHAILCRIVRATSRAERDAVAAVSRLFFQQQGDTLVHTRIECELSLYQTQREAASKAGKASAAKRNSVTKDQRPFNDRSTPVAFPLERNANGEGNETSTEGQPTMIHEPRTNNQTLTAKAPAKPKPEADPRFQHFVEVFTQSYQTSTGSTYPFAVKDGQQLKTLLSRVKDLTAEQFLEGLEWCRGIAASDRHADGCVRQTGSLAAFCAAWARIVEYSNTYTPPRR